MSRHAQTEAMLEAVIDVLNNASSAMTVRQVYYQLVSRQVIENNRSQYQAVSKLLVGARLDGTIGWDQIEDRLRRPRTPQMWTDLSSFVKSVRRSYHRDPWPEQEVYVEVWLEKDALSGIFEDILRPFGITLNVGRGYDGWSSINEASERLTGDAVILYFGDFDPSGEDMVRSLEERLNTLGSYPEVVKCALTVGDIQRYHLPPAMAKTSDTRSRRFAAQYGWHSAVELDALPVDVLRDRLRSEVEERIDLDALTATRQTEDTEVARLVEMLA